MSRKTETMLKGRCVMKWPLITLCAWLIAIGCGEKIPLPSVAPGDGDGSLTDTSFATVLPHWTEAGGIPFSQPHSVAVGYDRTILVCDTRNDRIVRLSVTGDFLESIEFPHPVSVAQDRALNLLVVNGGNAVWLRSHKLGGAFQKIHEKDSVLVCNGDPILPFCGWVVPSFSSVAATREATSRFYTFVDRQVIAIRTDVGVISVMSDSNGQLGHIHNPTSLATTEIRGKHRLLLAQFAGRYGVQYFHAPHLASEIDDPHADIYTKPQDDVKYIAADERGNVFVLHRAQGIVMMFDKDGRYILSFGRDGTDPLSLQDASGIAVLDDMILIADAKNNRIARYQLTAIPQN
jgi:hypothetical protein